MTSNAQALPVAVGLDGTPPSRAALDWAVDEARRRQLPLHLVVARDLPMKGRGPAEGVLADDPEAEAWLQAGLERAHELAPDLLVTTAVRHGGAGPILVAVSHDACLVVVGARGRGALTSAMLGSTSIDVAAHAACPVVVVRTLPEVTPNRPGVVVGVDGSEVSSEAVGQGFQHAAARDLPLTVVHTFQSDQSATPEGEKALTAESIAGWREKYPDVPVHQHVLGGHPVETLVSQSRGAELLIVGSRGRGGFKGMFLGSVSQGVLHHAHCPVMVVRGPDTDEADET